MKTLLLFRHAKSDWGADFDRDHDRPLNGRGVRSAKVMGRVLSGKDIAPGHVVSSTAVRARETFRLAEEAGSWDCSLLLESGFYGSSAQTVLELAADAPDVQRLMLVGHQPTWSSLVHRITGVRADMKTGSVAVIAMSVADWKELPTGHGELISLLNPRTYFDSDWDLGS